MALWNKLKDELNRAGRAAQEAFDEGKMRLDMMRSRQAMDKAAQKLGYAVYRARKLGGDIPTDEYARLSAEVANAEAEVERYETLLREAATRRKETGDKTPPADTPPASPPE
jgi:multidrug resistance efflux pump